MFRECLLILFFLFITSCVRSQGDSFKVQNETSKLDKNVRYGKLESGFTYYIRRNESPRQTIELHTIVKAGTHHEDEDQLEYAHLLEHLGAKATKHFPDLKGYFQRSGRNRHANTGTNHTGYFVSIPSEDKQILKNGLQVIRDWSQDIRLEPKSVDVERGAILGEMRTIDPYQKWLGRTIRKTILENTGYKVYNRDKARINIKKFNRKAFLRYYKSWYRPDLEAAIIVGDINVDSIESEVKRLFSDLKMPKDPKNGQELIKAQSIKLSGENRFITILDTVRPQLRLELISKRPNLEYTLKTQDDYHAVLLQQLYEVMVGIKSEQLEHQFNSPFSYFKTGYKKDQLAGGQITASRMRIKLNEDNPYEIKEKLLEGLTAWRQIHIGFTEEELYNAKELVLRNYNNKNYNTSSSLAWRYREHFINGKLALDPEEEIRLISDILNQFELKEVGSFIRENGNLNKNADFIFFRGKQINVPELDSLKHWVKEAGNKKVMPLETPLPPIKTLNDVAQIPSLNDNEKMDITENILNVSTIKLKNGIKILLKPTKPSSDFFANSISIQAFRPNRVPIGNRNDYLSAKMFPEVIKYTGAGPYTKFELDRFMKQKDIKLRFKVDKNFQMIFADSKIESVDELLNLLYLYTNNPRRDPEAFRAWKASQNDALKGYGLRGSSDFIMEEIFPVWFPKIPRLKVQDLEHITMDQILKISEHWFSDFTGYTFIVTGDFDKNFLIPKLVDKLASFPTRDKISPKLVFNSKFPLKKIKERIQFNNIDQAYVRLYFPVKPMQNLKTHIELRLLSQALGDRIWDRLREGCYAPGAGGEWMGDNIYAFRIHFDSKLGNEEKLIGYAMQEFRKLKENGVEREWFEKAIVDELKAIEEGFDNFSYFNFWPDYLQSKLSKKEDYVSYILKYGTLLEHFISLEDINAAAKKYFKEENLQQFLALPKDNI